jgi:K+-sensing histidine kinase KdpD
LGLAITERAVRFHGGRVAATNRAEGGLMVEIHLPLMAVPAGADETLTAVASDQWPVASGQRD